MASKRAPDIRPGDRRRARKDVSLGAVPGSKIPLVRGESVPRGSEASKAERLPGGRPPDHACVADPASRTPPTEPLSDLRGPRLREPPASRLSRERPPPAAPRAPRSDGARGARVQPAAGRFRERSTARDVTAVVLRDVTDGAALAVQRAIRRRQVLDLPATVLAPVCR